MSRASTELFSADDYQGSVGGERRIALKFGASWCSMCDDLDRAVLRTSAGAALFEPLAAYAVDFDRSREVATRFAILELPTVVVLDTVGVEVGRIVGFRGPRAWIADARAAIAADDPLPRLRAEAESGELPALLALGEALLSREPEQGVAVLERASFGDADESARALWTLARFYHRVRQDPATARFLWQQLALRWPASADAWWWYAKAQVELGRVELGSAGFAAWADLEPGAVEPLAEWTRFAGREKYEPARPLIRARVLSALADARGSERDALEELVMEVGRAF